MSYILIIGATSDMAITTAREYAKNGYDIYLAGRNISALKDIVADIQVRVEQTVKAVELDILNFEQHQAFYIALEEKPLGVISFIGYLGDQKQAEENFEDALQIINTNYTGLVSLFEIIAADFERRKSGFIVGVSSVAGDRGRKSNYLYGSAKAGFTVYLSGLRNRLFSSNVHVLTVKPGFVYTKMTESMELPEKLTAQPEDVAKDIYSAQQKGKNTIYSAWFWRYIMLIIKLIPEFQFKKMSL
jgi:short-subunit dehydrogenase